MPYAQQIAALQRELGRLHTMRRLAISQRRKQALSLEIARVEARILALRQAAAAQVRKPPLPPVRVARPRPVFPAWPSPSMPQQPGIDPSVADQEAATQAALVAADQAQIQAAEDAAVAEPSAVSKYGPWILLALVGGYAYARRRKGKKREAA